MKAKEKKLENKKHGRPNKNALIDIDENQVLELAERFWNKSEIAAFMNCHVDTITNRFQEIYLKGKENGKGKLRDWQLSSAKNGNVTMQIWLGKQYLGQSDKQESEVIMPNKITIKLPDALNGN